MTFDWGGGNIFV